MSTCSGDRFYDIFDKEEEIITECSIFWVNTNKTILEGRVIKIPFSDFPEDAKHLKLIWINTKKEDRVFIKNCSKEYKHKRIPISTQRYKDGGAMEKSVLDITDSLRHQKQGLTTSDVRDIEGIFVVKLRAQNIDSHFFYTQLPLNEDDNNFEEQLSYMNYKKTVKNYMILVGKIVISLMLMFLCLVMDVVCLNIISFLLKI